MPNPVDDLTEDQLEALPEGLRAEVRKNQEYRQQIESANTKAAAAEREAAFAKAGVTDSPLVQQLAKGYEGENDPAAIRTYFEGLGVDVSTGSTGVVASGPSDEELAQNRQVAQMGSASTGGGDIRFEDAINSAKNADEVMALIASAPEGATGRIDGRQMRIRPPMIE